MVQPLSSRATRQTASFPQGNEHTERKRLYEKYARRISVNLDLDRRLVSFQANKKEPFYRWLKFKEAFSSHLVHYCVDRFRPRTEHAPRILDPFAGAGTTLTTSTRLGWRATGIELLPVGTAAMKARLKADNVEVSALERCVEKLHDWMRRPPRGSYSFPHLRITQGAFSTETEEAISSFVLFTDQIEQEDVRDLFWFACLSVLEDVSYTRKDGQYLRWDSRSGRELKSSFNKGKIPNFWASVSQRLDMMLEDMRWRNGGSYTSNVNIIEGSCLDLLPTFADCSFDLVLTSPPYCNRYDYTRTYALELAFLGYTESALKSLRQTLLSATVENKAKKDYLLELYCKRNQKDRFDAALKVFSSQGALQEVLGILHRLRDQHELNNSNIPLMVENYFFEMCFVVHELARVLAPGGNVVMINDNVQYHGEEIPVDLILSHFAEQAGLYAQAIWVLPRGKGNSSQQMGIHGRNELRKCVYVWSKPMK